MNKSCGKILEKREKIILLEKWATNAHFSYLYFTIFHKLEKKPNPNAKTLILHYLFPNHLFR